jgi:glycosyltransferase involved in cell wall biosynthesis
MKKNILVFTTGFVPLSETFIYNQVKALSYKANVYVATTNILNNRVFKSDFISDFIIYNNVPVNVYDRIRSKMIRKGTPNPYFLPFSSQKKLIEFISEKKIQIIHAHYGVNAVKLIEVLKLFPKIKLFVSFHGYDASKQLDNKMYVDRLTELINYTPTFIYCTKALKENIDTLFPNKNIPEAVIPYGVDTDKINNIKAFNYTSTKVKIIHAGRLTEKKGVLDLVNTYMNLNNTIKQQTELHIVGDGEDYVKVKELIEKSNDNSIFLHGAKPHNDLLSLVKGTDIFVLNSRVSSSGDTEGLPNALLEAMALNKPVISTNHAGIPEVVKNMETGLLIPEKDNEALKKALEKLIANKGLRENLSENANQFIVKKYSLENMQKQLFQLFGL